MPCNPSKTAVLACSPLPSVLPFIEPPPPPLALQVLSSNRTILYWTHTQVDRARTNLSDPEGTHTPPSQRLHGPYVIKKDASPSKGLVIEDAWRRCPDGS